MSDCGRVRPTDCVTSQNSAGHGLQNDYGAEPARRPAETPLHAGAQGGQQRVCGDPERAEKSDPPCGRRVTPAGI